MKKKNAENVNSVALGETYTTIALSNVTKGELTEVAELMKQQTGMGIISYRQVLDMLIHSYRANNQ